MKSHTTLKNLIDIKHGFAFKGEFFKEYETKNILLTPGNFLVGGGFNNKKLKFYDGPLYDDYILQENDLIVTLTDLSKSGDTLGFPSYVPKDENHIFLHNQRLGKITIKEPKKILKKFLYYVLCHSDYRNEVLASATGSTVKHTSPERILSFEFTLPELSKQEQISKTLLDLDNKIQNLQNQNDTLEQIAQAIFKSWFVDFDRVTEFEDSDLGKIPKGWDVKKIGEVIELLYGKSLTKKNRVPGNIPVYGSSGIVGFHNESLSSKHGIIVGRKGNVGSVYWSSNSFYAIDTVYYVKTELSLHYVYRNFQNQNFINSDSSVPGLSRDQAYSLPILIPKNVILEKFENISSKIQIILEKNKNLILTLTKTRDTLLPKLMSGEIRA